MKENVTAEERLPKRLYNLPEAAHYLGRTVCSVRELIWSGKLPCIKAGRRIQLDRCDMDAWIESNKVVNNF